MRGGVLQKKDYSGLSSGFSIVTRAFERAGQEEGIRESMRAEVAVELG